MLCLGLAAVAHLLLVLELAGELLLLLAQCRRGRTARARWQQCGRGCAVLWRLLAPREDVTRAAQMLQVRLVLQVALLPVHLCEALQCSWRAG